MNQPDVDVATVGEALASLRAPAPLRFPANFWASPAGAESNLAIGLARLGHSVRWVSRLGGDACGEAITAALRGEGVEVCARADAAHPTGLMLLLELGANRATVEYRRAGSAASYLDRSDVENLGNPHFLHLTGITPALSASAREACFAAAEKVRSQGGKVSLDLNYRERLWEPGEAARVLRDLARKADVIIGGSAELGLICANPQDLLSEAEIVVEKLGSKGAAAWSRAEGHATHPGFPAVSVDAVGAGDGFCAGLLSGLLDGLDLTGALTRANGVGACAVSSRGDWQGYPRRCDLELLTAADSTRR